MIWRNLILSIIVIAVAAFVSYQLINMKSQPPKNPPKTLAALVEYQSFKPQDEIIEIHGLGIVEAAQSITVTPQVGGVVKKISPRLTVGSIVKKGEVLLNIDATDYQVALQEAQARVQVAKQEVRLEKGRAHIAQKEWDMMRKRNKKKSIDPEAKARALRQPQAAIAEAQLKIAKTNVRRAKVNVNRTRIKAPFNAIVMSENVDLGQLVGPTASIAKLVGTDSFWITTPIASDDLQWIDIPTQSSLKKGKKNTKKSATRGSPVEITYDLGTRRVAYQGYIVKQLYEVESTGRMTRLLIEIPQPLQPTAHHHALPLGAQVSVKIMGKKVKQLYKVPRTAIRNETQLWLFDASVVRQQSEKKLLPALKHKQHATQGRLKVVDVNILRKLKHYVLIDHGLGFDDQVITSRVATAVPGMQVQALHPHNTVAPL